jgi:methylated-DNA-[protein]-cysteine S-methyltransferase
MLHHYVAKFPVIEAIEIVSDGEYICALSPSKALDEQPDVSSMPSVVRHCVDELNEYFSGKRTVFTLPVRQNGTAFQQRVWMELQKIPCGQTISYAELARRVGSPKACSAVGSANGRNSVFIIIPCHRVINADGKLGGYALGLEIKQKLLEWEKRIQ